MKSLMDLINGSKYKVSLTSNTWCQRGMDVIADFFFWLIKTPKIFWTEPISWDRIPADRVNR